MFIQGTTLFDDSVSSQDLFEFTGCEFQITRHLIVIDHFPELLLILVEFDQLIESPPLSSKYSQSIFSTNLPRSIVISTNLPISQLIFHWTSDTPLCLMAWCVLSGLLSRSEAGKVVGSALDVSSDCFTVVELRPLHKTYNVKKIDPQSLVKSDHRTLKASRRGTNTGLLLTVLLDCPTTCRIRTEAKAYSMMILVWM